MSSRRVITASARLFSSSSSSSSPLRSISFSGAGFLGCYHLGVAQCLLDHKLLDPRSPSSSPQLLLGSSAGALVPASLLCGVPVDDAMTLVFGAAAAARAAGPLDVLSPGFSLVDGVAPAMVDLVTAAAGGNDKDAHVRERCNGGRLRVFLTDPGKLKYLGQFSAHAFADDFESLEHLTSACLLSSYVPVATGPLTPPPGSPLHRASSFMSTREVKQMTKGGGVDVLSPRDKWYDGALSQMFPKLDAGTIIISPLAMQSKGNVVICPKVGREARTIGLGSLRLDATTDNALAVRRMLISSDDGELQRIFAAAYDDAKRVLKDYNLA